MRPYDASTALVVDMQNDFADPAGSLWVAGGDSIIPFVNAQVRAARAAGALVAHRQDWVISLWRDIASISAFAGEDPTRAHYFPEDERYLLEMTPDVIHHEIAVDES